MNNAMIKKFGVMHKAVFIIIIIGINLSQCAVPGTFFWKPRLGLYLAHPTEKNEAIYEPTYDNIRKELVILINGYSVGLTVLALAAGYKALNVPYLHLHPLSAYFYTNAYRWGLRHLRLLPDWLGGIGSYTNTHKVWSRRYYYLDSFVPKWMQKMIFWVKSQEWKQEQEEFIKYKELAEPTFGKHYRYPNKEFTDFASQKTVETVEDISA